MPGAFLETPDGTGTLIRLKVVPGASRSVIAGLHGDRVKLRVAAPPEDGKANRAVISLLAQRLRLGKRALRIVHGETSPHKTIEIEGLAPTEVETRLLRS